MRAGRRPGPTATREEILAAARRLFGERGYDGTTIRAIAAGAGVNPALLHHYFGTKERVFVAALEFPVNPSELLPMLLEGPREECGERIARMLLTLWSASETREPFLALLRSAMTNENAARMLRQFIGTAVLGPVAEALGVPRLRITAAAGQMIGLALLRYVIRIEPLASAAVEEVVALVAPAIQRHLDGEGAAAP